jgi:hypothetical protein
MSPITHFLMGWAAANTAPSLSKRERAFVTWASVVPDIDGLGIIAEALTRTSSNPLGKLDAWALHQSGKQSSLSQGRGPGHCR